MNTANNTIAAEFARCVKEQAFRHKAFFPQDGVKLCYQAAFGAEHMLLDKGRALEYFEREYSGLDIGNDPVFEDISADFCRINLRGWQREGLEPIWLFNMFCATAGAYKQPQTAIEEYLDVVGDVANCGELPFTVDEWQKHRREYERGGIRVVHHGEAYRKSEKPAYRVVSREYKSVFAILKICAKACGGKAAPNVIAIDGRAAAGKTTLAELLSNALGAPTVHMDDFFLPKEMRTTERLSEVGGNVHYERFAAEVLKKLKNGESFEYGVFDCKNMEICGKRLIEPKKWIITEGSYSLHPNFGNYATIKIFMDVDEKEQLRRISKRNGEAVAGVFKKRWIPMEEKYIGSLGVDKAADIVLKLE